MHQEKNMTERFSVNIYGGNSQIISDGQNSMITQNNYSSNLRASDVLSLIEHVKETVSMDLDEICSECYCKIILQ